MNAILSLTKLLAERAELDKTLATKLQKSILQEAIQGKLVPQDSNDEPATVLLERIREEKKKEAPKEENEKGNL